MGRQVGGLAQEPVYNYIGSRAFIRAPDDPIKLCRLVVEIAIFGAVLGQLRNCQVGAVRQEVFYTTQVGCVLSPENGKPLIHEDFEKICERI